MAEKDKTLDSIFQIKINENKLQKILNDLSREQYRQGQEFKTMWERIGQHNQNGINFRIQFESKLSDLYGKINKSIQNFQEREKILERTIKEMQKKIERQAQESKLKLDSLQQQKILQNENMENFQREIQEKINKITQMTNQMKPKTSQFLLQQPFQSSTYEKSYEKSGKGQSKIESRISELERRVQGTSQVMRFLQDPNFMYFLQYLVDKEVGIKVTQTMKQYWNPFNNETHEEKMKRYKELKKNLLQTQNKLNNLQSEYNGLYRESSQSSKQVREQAHLYYALLSTKIKELEIKVTEQQINMLQFQQPQKILYPNDVKDVEQKSMKYGFKSLFNQNQQNNSSILNKTRKIVSSAIMDEFQQLKTKLEGEKSILWEKVTRLEDQAWSATNKLQRLKESTTSLRGDIDKLNQKIKLQMHYHQFGNEKDSISFKTIGEFIYQFRNIQDSIEQKMKQMIDNKNFNKNMQQINEKVKILSQVADSKANKDEMRKAFTFIEEKIKQIVTLIADMQNSSKKTLGRKMIVQCLSCDDNFFEQMHPQRQGYDPGATRATTSRTASIFNIRQRQKKAKQNIPKQIE